MIISLCIINKFEQADVLFTALHVRNLKY